MVGPKWKTVLVVQLFVSQFTDVSGFYCWFFECCNSAWIPNDYMGLQTSLQDQVFGQHIAREVLVNTLKGHSLRNPSKALSLSFHGWTGTGKNLVSNLMAKAKFYKGPDSSFVHFFSSTRDFPHKSKINEYKDNLRERIESEVKRCGYSLFVFDEMHEMPEGLIDVLVPYLSHHEHLSGVDYRKATFDFLSNAGSVEISERVFRQWQKGVDREDIQLNDMEELLHKATLTSNGQGFFKARLLTEHLMTALVPFLPLERHHVKQCIRREMQRQNIIISETRISNVVDEFKFFPDKERIYSVRGCKMVSEKVSFHFNDEL